MLVYAHHPSIVDQWAFVPLVISLYRVQNTNTSPQTRLRCWDFPQSEDLLLWYISHSESYQISHSFARIFPPEAKNLQAQLMGLPPSQEQHHKLTKPSTCQIRHPRVKSSELQGDISIPDAE